MKELTSQDLQDQIAALTQAVALLTVELARRSDSSARLLKPKEVGVLIGYSVAEVYAKMDAGVIPWITLEDDGTKRVPLVGLQALIREKLKGAPNIDPDWLSNVLSGEARGYW
jgi:hypothetical protein